MTDQVVVVCENELAKEGLCRIIEQEEFTVIGKGAFLKDLDWDSIPDDTLTLIDCPKGCDPIALVEEAVDRFPSCRCIVLADQFDLQTVMTCFNRGAAGYLLKNMHCPPLLAALRLAALGERVLPSELIDAIAPISNMPVQTRDRKTLKVNLSEREEEVLQCLMAGYSNKVIARTLDVSEATIKVHVKAILRKLKVANRTQAALWGSNNRFGSSKGPFPLHS